MSRPFNSAKAAAYDNVGKSEYYRSNLKGLSAHDRHRKFVNDYLQFYGGDAAPQQREPGQQLQQTDRSALEQHYRFIRTEQDDAPATWEVRLAKRYYERLFREYCIADLSRYKESKLGLRWRTQQEVVAGKGHFSCGAKGCAETTGLASYEVDFAYVEAGERKQALVKLRVCPGCAFKLNYRKERKLAAQAAAAQATAAAAGGTAGTKRSATDAEGVGGHQRGAKAVRTSAAELIASLEAASEAEGAKQYVMPPPGAAAGGGGPAAQGGGAHAGPSSSSAGAGAAGAGAEQASVLPGDDSVWEAKAAAQEAVTQEEEFDEYFGGMFL